MEEALAAPALVRFACSLGPVPLAVAPTATPTDTSTEARGRLEASTFSECYVSLLRTRIWRPDDSFAPFLRNAKFIRSLRHRSTTSRRLGTLTHRKCK